jgi:outer membrane protein
MRFKQIIFSWLVIRGSWFVEAARAEEFKLDASAGAVGYWAPQYEGAAKYVPYYLPVVDIQYGPLFASVAQGAGVYIPVNASRTVIFAPAIRWRAKRDLGDGWDTIEYIENIRPTATLNSIVKVAGFMFNFRMTDGLSGDNKGANFNLGAAYDADLGGGSNVVFYSTAIYGNAAYNQTYFGVTADESARFGFDEYDAGKGLKSLDAGAVLKYFITKNVAIQSSAEYLRLVGAAASSPITKARDQWTAGVGAVYKF